MSLYFLAFFKPQKLWKKVYRFNLEIILVGGSSKKRKIFKVRWDLVTRSKDLGGGLVISSIEHKNSCMLFKWIWRLDPESDDLW